MTPCALMSSAAARPDSRFLSRRFLSCHAPSLHTVSLPVSVHAWSNMPSHKYYHASLTPEPHPSGFHLLVGPIHAVAAAAAASCCRWCTWTGLRRPEDVWRLREVRWPPVWGLLMVQSCWHLCRRGDAGGQLLWCSLWWQRLLLQDM